MLKEYEINAQIKTVASCYTSSSSANSRQEVNIANKDITKIKATFTFGQSGRVGCATRTATIKVTSEDGEETALTRDKNDTVEIPCENHKNMNFICYASFYDPGSKGGGAGATIDINSYTICTDEKNIVFNDSMDVSSSTPLNISHVFDKRGVYCLKSIVFSKYSTQSYGTNGTIGTTFFDDSKTGLTLNVTLNGNPINHKISFIVNPGDELLISSTSSCKFHYIICKEIRTGDFFVDNFNLKMKEDIRRFPKTALYKYVGDKQKPTDLPKNIDTTGVIKTSTFGVYVKQGTYADSVIYYDCPTAHTFNVQLCLTCRVDIWLKDVKIASLYPYAPTSGSFENLSANLPSGGRYKIDIVSTSTGNGYAKNFEFLTVTGYNDFEGFDNSFVLTENAITVAEGYSHLDLLETAIDVTPGDANLAQLETIQAQESGALKLQEAIAGIEEIDFSVTEYIGNGGSELLRIEEDVRRTTEYVYDCSEQYPADLPANIDFTQFYNKPQVKLNTNLKEIQIDSNSAYENMWGGKVTFSTTQPNQKVFVDAYGYGFQYAGGSYYGCGYMDSDGIYGKSWYYLQAAPRQEYEFEFAEPGEHYIGLYAKNSTSFSGNNSHLRVYKIIFPGSSGTEAFDTLTLTETASNFFIDLPQIETIQAQDFGALKLQERVCDTSAATLHLKETSIEWHHELLAQLETIKALNGRVVPIKERIIIDSHNVLLLNQKIYGVLGSELALTEQIKSNGYSLLTLTEKLLQGDLDALTLIEDIISKSGANKFDIKELIKQTGADKFVLTERVISSSGSVLPLTEVIDVLTQADRLDLYETAIEQSNLKLSLIETIRLNAIRELLLKEIIKQTGATDVYLVEHVVHPYLTLLETVIADGYKTRLLSANKSIRLLNRKG